MHESNSALNFFLHALSSAVLIVASYPVALERISEQVREQDDHAPVKAETVSDWADLGLLETTVVDEADPDGVVSGHNSVVGGAVGKTSTHSTVCQKDSFEAKFWNVCTVDTESGASSGIDALRDILPRGHPFSQPSRIEAHSSLARFPRRFQSDILAQSLPQRMKTGSTSAHQK